MRADERRAAVREKYGAVARQPEGHFAYPIGRDSALRLGYDPAWIDAIPREIVDLFVGVGNPFSLHRPGTGERVLDVGCGAGFDVFVASLLGADAAGVDLTPEMLEPARKAAWPGRAPAFHEGSAEALPFDDASFDAVISNGALNLVPDKERAYAEIGRVLRTGGTLAVADLLVVETIPDEVLADQDAWST